MPVEAVIDIELCQGHISIRVIAREMKLVIEQAPSANLSPVGLEELRAVVINEKGVEGDKDDGGNDSQPSFVLADGKDMFSYHRINFC